MILTLNKAMANGTRSSATRLSRPRSSTAGCITQRRWTSQEKATSSKNAVKLDCFPRQKHSRLNQLPQFPTLAASEIVRREFLRHGQIYQSDRYF
jgi:hypothetical protein